MSPQSCNQSNRGGEDKILREVKAFDVLTGYTQGNMSECFGTKLYYKASIAVFEKQYHI